MQHLWKLRCAFLPILALLLCSWSPSVQGQGSGYWHTSGAQVLDGANTPVRIAGINWYGFETTDMVAHGLMLRDYKAILQSIKSNGYNTIRIPFSNQMVENPVVPTAIQYSNSAGPINTDLQGLNSLQILDAVIAEAGQLGLRVILDNHRSEAGNGAQGSGLWYTDAYPETAWIQDWTNLAERYVGNTTVIGFDLRNEPHNANSGGSCWSCGSQTNDWHLAAERAGNAVLAVNPKLLIFVEGTDVLGSDYAFWGGQLAGVASAPVMLNVSQQLVYSAHDYGPAESAQSWLNNATYDNLTTYWDAHWGYIAKQGIAPVWVGEFGTLNSDSDAKDTTPGSQGLWFSSLIQYFSANPSLNWTYWALNGEDRYGLLPSDYSSAPQNALKQQELASIQFTLSDPGNQTPTLALVSKPAVVSAAASTTDTGSSTAPTQAVYTATLSNPGTAALTTPTVKIVLPLAATLLSTNGGSGSSCSSSSGTASCSLATIAPGQTGTLTVTVLYLASALDFSAATSVSESATAVAHLSSGDLSAVAATTVVPAAAQTVAALIANVTPMSTITYGTPAMLNVSLTPVPTTALPASAFTATLDGTSVPVTVAGANRWQVALGTLGGGQHQAVVQFAATAGHPDTSVSVPITVNSLAPTVTVTGGGSSVYGQAVQVTAAVAGGSGLTAPTGTITATLDSGAALKGALNNGQATISFNSLVDVGTHTITLSYGGDSNYAVANQSATAQVTPASLTAVANAATRVFGAANPVFTGTLAGVVTGDNIAATYVSSADNTTAPGVYLTGANAIAPVLSDPQSRLKNYTVTLNSAPLTITAAATISWSNPPAIVYGTPLTAMQLNATATPALTLVYSPPVGSILTVGTQKLTVSGTSATVLVPVSDAVQIVVQQAPTTTIISAPSTITSPYTITATVTSAEGGAVSGPVNFFDGGALIGSGMLDAKGTASFVIPSLSSGQHSFTATFPGDPNNLLSSSSAAVVAGQTGSFTLAALPTSLEMKAGGTGSTVLSLAPKGGISGSVALSCSGLPTGSRCTFAPAQLTLDGSASTQETTVTVALPTVSSNTVPFFDRSRTTLAGCPALLLLAVFYPKRKRLALKTLIVSMFFVVVSLTLSGCQVTKAADASTTGTYIGSYNATVTAVSGTITQTATITVNVLQ